MRNLLVRIFLALSLTSCASTKEPSSFSSTYLGSFDGVWEGVFTPVLNQPSPFETPTTVRPMRFVIDGDSVEVYTASKGRYKALSSRFKILRHKTNAIIYYSNSSKDTHDVTGKGGWVETQNITLTLKSKGSMYGHKLRVINNYTLKSDYDDGETKGRMVFSYTGEFKRVF